jgi:hypothetical protein
MGPIIPSAHPPSRGFFLSPGSHGSDWEVEDRRGRAQGPYCACRRAGISTRSHRRGTAKGIHDPCFSWSVTLDPRHHQLAPWPERFVRPSLQVGLRPPRRCWSKPSEWLQDQRSLASVGPTRVRALLKIPLRYPARVHRGREFATDADRPLAIRRPPVRGVARSYVRSTTAGSWLVANRPLSTIRQPGSNTAGSGEPKKAVLGSPNPAVAEIGLSSSAAPPARYCRNPARRQDAGKYRGPMLARSIRPVWRAQRQTHRQAFGRGMPSVCRMRSDFATIWAGSPGRLPA